MKRIIIFTIIALFLVPIIYRSISYFKQNKDAEAKFEPDERRLIGRVSEQNSRVKEIQEILKNHGFDAVEADGFIGPQTRQALKKFQETNGLKSTGTLDQSTLMFLEKAKKANGLRVGLATDNKITDLKAAQAVVNTAEKTKLEGLTDKPAIHDEILNYRLNPKEHIKKIQFALKSAGFYKGEIDGKMGPRTKSAIREFQKTKKLTSDGIVGSRTWEALTQYLKD